MTKNKIEAMLEKLPVWIITNGHRRVLHIVKLTNCYGIHYMSIKGLQEGDKRIFARTLGEALKKMIVWLKSQDRLHEGLPEKYSFAAVKYCTDKGYINHIADAGKKGDE